ncbi:tRNA uridine-5-carboxymethylaminomethyl(34) synthesis GTPase MnmE [Mycoplasmopsis anatis]|uniref:tRNA modification GTPase MnmE n=1 Tax=Mycoplasmopsis anatis TaxID=171279 RepID=A0A9Q3L615_9BACT|nr:tRNA uridine-5-carboxymethylaminomethyl(34) synthesis GTPase MnmE [Mycoplasmopsis anatis]MBW0594330.1 tRNA uridine-5-carboxymethylaminomethyl(34) synthesis GTPase MnmE [Mycoplasmopsis anatis]MBW0595153.1 tRNA uridine-5-carboxymethylaminomethyl(34) synthesis GTPase MnmE [Mycoplasmopsis anatis]MBW0596018.1 tRNA uridine-5-carboxymethylaminomethyl(34) synthesis GTPase MnmE [Mycoplasmopsis anatis]MBW0596563.1 tRNA uridine-5-carboxymethylaminomethyl(34) synthesis GTPase MnmE [Mycoplasmopsis anatis
MFDTIAAISSGNKVNQPISIIRISGPNTLEIMNRIFKGKVGKDHEITYGHIIDGNKSIIDEVLVMWFIGKMNNDNTMIFNNYVGDILVEINCHGGILVTNLILELILSNGARLALPGEFTRRAFLNGKMDLVKAEAIHDLIMAKTKKQASAAIKKFDGKTSNLINALIKEIEYLIGLCEVNIDYPEYDDIEKINDEIMKEKLTILIKKINEIVKLSQSSRLIFEGVKVAILGKPNVGKSSLLNALLNEEKAIVTDIAGTTRDIIEENIQLDGILFKLIDTAGLRQTEEKIEIIGIKKSLEQIERADLLIHVLDPKQKNDRFDFLIKEKANELNKIYIPVANKKDICNNEEIKRSLFDLKIDNISFISALNGDIDELKTEMIRLFKDIDIESDIIVTNTRQLSLVQIAFKSLVDALNSLNNDMTFDVIIIDITKAWESLKEITGVADKEDLLDAMFSNFCLGK